MKKSYLWVLCLMSSSAFAGGGSCNTDQIFMCDSVYNLKNSTKLSGPSQESNVENLQAEAFDPADCEAVVALYTPVGKLMAEYSQTAHTLDAWLEYDGSGTTFARTKSFGVGEKFSVVVPEFLKGDIQSVEFDCRIERD